MGFEPLFLKMDSEISRVIAKKNKQRAVCGAQSYFQIWTFDLPPF
jgi:hypothetical protein